jgi:hypothetical protein
VFELCGTRESSSKCHRLVTLGAVEPLSPGYSCERSRAHLAGAVKGNSIGIEVWRGSLIQVSSYIKCDLIEEWLEL